MKKQLFLLLLTPALLLTGCKNSNNNPTLTPPTSSVEEGQKEITIDEFKETVLSVTDFTFYDLVEVKMYDGLSEETPSVEFSLVYNQEEDTYGTVDVEDSESLSAFGASLVYLMVSFAGITSMENESSEESFFDNIPEGVKLYKNPYMMEYESEEGYFKYAWNDDGMPTEYISQESNDDGTSRVSRIEFKESGEKHTVSLKDSSESAE